MTTLTTRLLAVVLTGLALTSATAHAGGPPDPLDSVMWDEMREQFFGDASYTFDGAVKVSVPKVLENQAQVPVTVDARALGKVKKLVVFSDLNPVQHTLTMTPFEAAPFISFRLKVEQATPVRAAALTEDGVWHVGGVFLDAAGGGCSSPAMARNKPDWALTVGNTKGRAWRQADGMSRFRMSIKHPMDTGLTQDNIPAFYIEQVLVRGASGKVLAKVEMREPVSEDPTITMMVRLPVGDRAIRVDSRDIDGNQFSARIKAGWTESRLNLPQAVAE
ncbi:MAG: quinoprotein dehydrogenase-associated SoxYZ-like carrier [Alphaproteobacteria bacterium]|nr:quinoprotein dehydrogenase-associated SoxYZ-like carrier [Alphaproteobacteria bacterium]